MLRRQVSAAYSRASNEQCNVELTGPWCCCRTCLLHPGLPDFLHSACADICSSPRCVWDAGLLSSSAALCLVTKLRMTGCVLGAEMMVKAYMTSYKLPCIITRGNNVYVPCCWCRRLCCDIDSN